MCFESDKFQALMIIIMKHKDGDDDCDDDITNHKYTDPKLQCYYPNNTLLHQQPIVCES